MNALSLFSGIGGIDLAAEWAGIKTVAMCEREPFCQKVLKKHWPDVPVYDDVCTLTKERLEADGVGTIDVIFSGDPCQPYSTAGKREGEEDDRFLWPEVNRLLATVRPRWIVRENVAGNITLGLDGVLTDLDDLGYTARTDEIGSSLWPTLPASEWKGVPRNRFWGSPTYRSDKVASRFRTRKEDLTHLNPDYAEAFMGFPTGWLELNHQETP